MPRAIEEELACGGGVAACDRQLKLLAWLDRRLFLERTSNPYVE
jgi:hypothetical protein